MKISRESQLNKVSISVVLIEACIDMLLEEKAELSEQIKVKKDAAGDDIRTLDTVTRYYEKRVMKAEANLDTKRYLKIKC